MDEQMREKFEAWAKDREYDTKKFAGEYEDFDARQAWFVWQAAAAATKEIHMDEQMPPLNHYDAAAHMYPCDLEEFKDGEIVREAFSIPVGSPTHGESVPLWTTEQMFAYAKEYAAALSQPAASQVPLTDEQIWKLHQKHYGVTRHAAFARAIEAAHGIA